MPRRALVVDNDFFFVDFLEKLLEKRGYRVAKAYDGKEGLLELENGPFDILFADLIMPKIDGLQFIRIARSKYSDLNFRIIAVSGSVLEQLDELSDAEADWFVAKGPIEQMETQINDLLDQVESGGISLKDASRFLDSGVLYPRQVTGELIETLNFQKAVIESIGLGVLVVDKDARVINATSQALEILNASPGDILNKHIVSLFPLEERPYLTDALKAVARNLGLRKVCLNIAFEAKGARLTISLLKLGKTIAGWIVAMEETNQ
jgi:CheY-like chemotaxis protein